MNTYGIATFLASLSAVIFLTGCPMPPQMGGDGGGGGGGQAPAVDAGSVPLCDPSACPDVGECSSRGCEINGGGCVAVPLPKYTACSTGLCDGNGACVPGMCVLASRCPDPPTPSCASKYCGADDRCHFFDYEPGTGCDSDGGACDGMGNCVAPPTAH